MKTLKNPLILFDQLPGERLSEKMADLLKDFYNELDLVMEQNDIVDFHEWFSEIGYVSMFFNGLVRNDIQKKRTTVQEYLTRNLDKNEKYRCDGFLNNDGEVMIFEAKQSYENGLNPEQHFNIDGWMKWDEGIRTQLQRYYKSDQNFYSSAGRFKRTYLVTLCFKTFKVNAVNHLTEAVSKLAGNITNTHNCQWYYSLAFFGECDKLKDHSFGIEVYGTITDPPKV